MTRVVVLVENNQAEHKALAVEHGLSFWIETADRAFMFDCGASDKAVQNAHALGIDLTRSACTVCSHSHYDHAAGYRPLVEHGLAAPVLYTGDTFFQTKYAFDGVQYTNLSCGFDAAFLQTHHIEHRIVGDLLELMPSMWLVGNFKRQHPFETVLTRFVRGTPPNVTVDNFDDEICLAIAGEQGLSVIVGCSHPGILNMVSTVSERLHMPIYSVIGGTHLVQADAARMQQTIAALAQLGVKMLAFNHCSGGAVQAYIENYAQITSCRLSTGCEIVL